MSATAELPTDEAARLAAVRRYDILDTPPDGAFDRVTALAARFCRTPISTITIVDEDRIWFKSCRGVEVDQIGRDPGLCASAILQSGAYTVANAIEDPRTLDNPLVRGELGLRFYAAVPLRTADGHNLGTLNVIDVEPREITDGELDTLADLAAVVMDELELRLAAQRRIELEAAREAAALRASIVAGISHQMRTPIAVLHGIASLEPGDDAERGDLRTMMRRHVRELDWLVNQFLDFTTIEAGGLPILRQQPTNVAALVADAVDTIATAVPVAVEQDGSLPPAAVDAQRTRQILAELLNNAVRVSPSGAEVRVRVRASSEGTVNVSVDDEGPGVPASERSRIFDKFRRGDESTGSGIGLYVARTLARAQGGRIEVGESPEGGSRFTLVLPVHSDRP